MTTLVIPPEQGLADQFEFELCGECGGWFARCNTDPADDLSYVTARANSAWAPDRLTYEDELGWFCGQPYYRKDDR
jgi:hypothetical protein